MPPPVLKYLGGMLRHYLPRPLVPLGLLVAILVATSPRPAAAQSRDSSGAGSINEAGGASDEGGVDAGGRSLGALNAAKAALAAIPPDHDAARIAFAQATAADDDLGAVAEAYFRLGFLEEEDGAFEKALVAQRACMLKAPSSSWARSARQRIHWMTARSEGLFEPLARLQRVRRNPVLANDPTAIEALARDAEAFPPGRVRAEARMFVAEAWLTRMNRPSDAIPELRKVAEDPSSDSMDAGLARQRLPEAFLALGQLDSAEGELVRSPSLDPELSAQVHRLIRRRALRRIAVAELAAFGVLVVAGIATARARRGRSTKERVRLVLGAVWPAVPATAVVLVAISWSSRAHPRGGWLLALAALALGPLLTMARVWDMAGSRRPRLRAGRMLICALSVVAATLLIVDAASPTYLEGLGL